MESVIGVDELFRLERENILYDGRK